MTTSSESSPPFAGATADRRIARRFAELKAAQRKALVCYLTAGYPDMERSIALLQGVADAGADVIEVGVPFSDPMADGPVIQASSQVALDHGMTLDRTLELVERAALAVPVVLFSYLNPVFAAGPSLLPRAAAAGVDGLLVTDLPVGADPALERSFTEGPLDFVRLVAPTTPDDRMREIGRHASGFLYLISRMGVTGVREDVPAELQGIVARLRAAASLPVCVGFGISRPEQAAAVAHMADGVVVGSALVRAAGESVEAAVRLARELRQGIDDRA